MYQSDSENGTENEAGLFEHAARLIEDAGLKGLSLRSLAQSAGMSPSLLIYRYGSRDGIISRFMQLTRQQDEADWSARESAFGAVDVSRSDLPALALAVVMDTVTRTRSASLLQWICLTASHRDLAYKPVADGWPDAAVSFWSRRLRQMQLDETLAAPLAAVLSGATRIGLLAQGNPRQFAWMNDVVLRLCERLLGQVPSSPGDSVTRQAVEAMGFEKRAHKQTSRTETPERIVESAAALIISHGPDMLTHRLIAEQSGISLSSMTHHFSSLDEIMLLAFERIYDTARLDYLSGVPVRISLGELTSKVLPDMLSKVKRRGPESAVMDEIILFSSRKPDTLPLAGALQAMTGQTSAALIGAVAPKQAASDRLDGQIFRFVLTGLSDQSPEIPQSKRDAWMIDMCRHFIEAYWGL